MFKADKFQLEPVVEGKHSTLVSRMIEGFRAEKYKMKTTFTMTKYKIDVGEIQTIQKYETFDDYLNGCRKFHS
jgi:hypothetical protein